MVNKLAIGTVQFGKSYGISNQGGQTSVEEVSAILAYAYEHGIVTLDTAAVYGNSEAVLGNVLSHHNHKAFQIVTKTPQFYEIAITSKELSLLRVTFEQSLKYLGVNKIEGLLVHACDDLFVENGHRLYNELEELKAQGKVNKIGVSVYSSQQIARVLNEFTIDLVQLPINAFDQRFIEDGSLDRLKEKNVEIHARSIFLQGLLLMPVENISPWFAPIIPLIKRYRKLAKDMEINSLQLALGFVNTLQQVDRVLVGVNNLAQLKEIIKAKNTLIDITRCQELSIKDSRFINPKNWQV